MTDQAAQPQLLTFQQGVTGNRHLTAAIQMLIQCALGSYPQRRFTVMQRRQQSMNLAINTATLDTHSTLAAGRQAGFDADRGANPRGKAQANQAGSSENDGVVLASIQLGQTGINVATQKMNLQVRAQGQ